MSKNTSATTSKVRFGDRFRMAMRLHKKNAIETFFHILQQPANSLLTILVLAVALALPSSFYVFTSNAKALSSDWNGGVKMALYLSDATTDSQADELVEELRNRHEFQEVTFKTKQQSLEEFQQFSGLSDAIESLDSNPMPMTIELTPQAHLTDLAELEPIVAQLRANPFVERAQLDADWIQKYQSFIDIAEQVARFVSILLAAGVLLIVGNTIRLAILSRREEIQIIKLVGATDAFIRRPFLYTGLWYGFIASFIAALMVSIFMVLLRNNTSELAFLYQSEFSLLGLAPLQTLSLIGIGCALGLFGAWFSVSKHLRDIKPN